MKEDPKQDADICHGLCLEQLSKAYGNTQALESVSFEVHRGEIVAVLGPSGCGKSTLLNLIAGLESPDAGRVLWDQRPLAGMPPHKRGFGLMFQDFALFPHMNVFGNVAFGLQMAHVPEDEIQPQVSEALTMVGLDGFGDRDVNTLSGGEQQRVALARSLVPKPHLLMLDEPLGSLDRTLRERLMMELGEILRRFEQTALYVTHDQEEAFAVADRVVVLQAGRMAQVGTPEAIYRHPASLFVARFLGFENFLTPHFDERDGRRVMQTEIGSWPWDSAPEGCQTVLLRPDQVYRDQRGSVQLQGIVQARSFRGSLCRAQIRVQDLQLTFDFTSEDGLPALHQPIQLSFDPQEAIQCLP